MEIVSRFMPRSRPSGYSRQQNHSPTGTWLYIQFSGLIWFSIVKSQTCRGLLQHHVLHAACGNRMRGCLTTHPLPAMQTHSNLPYPSGCVNRHTHLSLSKRSAGHPQSCASLARIAWARKRRWRMAATQSLAEGCKTGAKTYADFTSGNFG